jgi:small-conductance mechanosensitive channel
MKEFVKGISELAILEIMLIGLLLFLGLRVVQKGLSVYTRKKQMNSVINRLFPMFEFSAWILFVVWSAKQVFQTGTGAFVLLLALLASILIWTGNFVVRDWIAGIVFKAEGRYRLDDIICIYDTQGRLTHLGYRSLTIETPDGSAVEIPFSALARKNAIKKIPKENACCLFTLSVPAQEPFQEVRQRLQTLAWCAPWSSIIHKPQIRVITLQENHYTVEVAAFVIDPVYAPEVEAYVKQHLNYQ